MAEADGARAVLVDENLMFTMMLEPALRRLGYQVRSLPGKASVAEAVAQFEPTVVFINLAADRYPGVEVVRAVRGHSATARTPIVGYAGHVERDRFAAGREAGADLVVPNSAMRDALPEVLAKLKRRLAGGPEDEPGADLE